MALPTGNGAAPRGRDRRRLSFHLSAIWWDANWLPPRSVQFNAALKKIGFSSGEPSRQSRRCPHGGSGRGVYLQGGQPAGADSFSSPTRKVDGPGTDRTRNRPAGRPPSERSYVLSSTPRIRSLPGVCLPPTPESRRKSPRCDSRPQNRRRWETPRRH